MKVLIVDDSNVIRKAIQKYIAKYELDVVGQAADGVTALEIFREKKPEVVTLDITMPEMDGITCLEEMLKIDPAAKIVIITAVSAKKMALTAMEKGAAGFISKPFNEEKLDKTLSKILGEA